MFTPKSRAILKNEYYIEDIAKSLDQMDIDSQNQLYMLKSLPEHLRKVKFCAKTCFTSTSGRTYWIEVELILSKDLLVQ